ncbi:Nucleoid-associated protein YejK [compost metagenome]
MSIILNKVIIHELVKEQREGIKPSVIREHVINATNPSIINLVEGVVGLYGKKNNSSQYGVFKTGEGKGDFPSAFNKYYSHKNATDNEFRKISLIGMEELFKRAESESLSSGGYILFADYISNDLRYFITAMIKQKPGYKITGELSIEDLEYIDLSRLHQASKISFDKYGEYQNSNELERQDINYLSFVSPASNKTSGYFILAFGCQAGAPSARATQAVVNESVAYFQKNDELKDYAIPLRTKLYDYLESKRDTQDSAKLSEIEKIARQFFPADSADKHAENLVEHLNSDAIGVPYEFVVNKSKLQKMTHIVYRGDDLQIVFDKDDLGRDHGAKYCFTGDKLVINELPEALKEMLNEHFKPMAN